MADKRIHELVETSDKSGKYIAVDEAGLSEALKYDTDNLLDKAQTDVLYVKLTGNETVNGVKTWNNQGIFEAGIIVNAGGINVTGNSIVAGTFESITGGYTIKLNGQILDFDRAGANYITCSTTLGYLLFVTNGLSPSSANANLVLKASGESYFNNKLAVNYSATANAELHIQGNGIFGNQSTFVNVGGTYRIQIATTTTNGFGVLYLGGNRTDQNAVGQVIFTNLASSASGKRIAGIYGNNATDPDAGNLQFYCADQFGNFGRKMIITDEGHVGIGIVNPADKFVVYDATEDIGILIKRNVGTSQIRTGYIRFESDAAGRYAEISGKRETASTRHGLRFFYFNVTSLLGMTLDSSGRIGIGTETPAEILHIKSVGNATVQILDTGAANTYLQFQNATVGKWYIGYTSVGATGFGFLNGSGQLKLILTQDGNLGIGTDSPGTKLHVAGDIWANTHLRSSTTTVMVSPISTGSCYFRPDGKDSATGQSSFTTVAGSIGTPLTILGHVGINTPYSTGTQILTLENDLSYLAWSDFPTTLPANRGIAVNRAAANYGSNDYTAIYLMARGSSGNSSYGVIAVQSEGTGLASRMNFMLRGSTTTDYRTPFKMDAIGKFWFQTKDSDEDVKIHLVQGSTTIWTLGYVYGQTCFQIHSGTGFASLSSADFSISNGGLIYMGNITEAAGTHALRYNPTTGLVTYN
jgi:hypothetical protein